MNETTIQIIDTEWAMFDAVDNIGGRAGCQDDRETFVLMRASQLDAWTEELRRSYLDDLREAKAESRNPLSEKYGYMMERTDPEGYAAIAPSLPPRSPEKLALIAQITPIQVKWRFELGHKYPVLSGRGRSADRDADSLYATSFETYLLGELSTYSEQTLTLYLDYVLALDAQGKSLNEMILENTTRLYGYPSPEAAEQAVS